MRSATQRSILSIAAVTLAVLLPASTSATNDAEAQVRSEINKTMQAFMAAWATQASPRELADLLYDTSNEFALVGEGLRHPVEEVQELLTEFETLRNEWREGCAFTLRGPVQRSGPLAATLNVLGCPESGSIPGFDYYVLLVWRHTDRGWRVVMESYSAFTGRK